MASGFDPSVIRVPKAGELVAAQLRRQIVTGELKPGDPLPGETELMERFGVSRPTMREAFRILESEASIVVLRGAHGGARVLAPDETVAARHMGLLLQYRGVPLTDLYQARAELEIAALRISGPDLDLTSLSDLVAEAAEVHDDPLAFAKTDTRVHQAIVDLGEVRTMSIMVGMLLHIMDSHNTLFISSRGVENERVAGKVALASYRKLLRLLRSGDKEEAINHWRKHLGKVDSHMLANSNTSLVEVLS